jgi:tetratricopeptide (TPR) repeat protein
LPDLDRAIHLFQRAVDNDPNFALAYAAMAETYAVKVTNGKAPPDTLRAGEAAAQKALAFDPTSADAHTALGLLKYSRWDWQGAEREYDAALRLDPANARALMRSAMVSFVTGRFPEAESRLRHAQLVEPSNGAIAGMLCELYYYWRRYDDCIRQADHILQFDPANFALAWSRKTAALVQEGRLLEARIAAQQYAKSSPPNDASSQIILAWVDTGGVRAQFEPRFHQILQTHQGQYLSPYVLACTYAAIGDKENTFRQLEIAYRQRVTDLVSVKWDPVFDSIRSDPRYTNLLVRMGLSSGTKETSSH